MIKKRIDKLRNQFIRYNIDGYVIPKNDEFFSEYSNKDRLKIISNFTGSAGYAVILKKKSFLFVDELPEKHLEKNSFFDDEINNNDDFDFNQDFEIEEGTRSPGWIRYQKRIK